MGRNARYVMHHLRDCIGDYHIFNNEIHMGRNVSVCNAPSACTIGGVDLLVTIIHYSYS